MMATADRRIDVSATRQDGLSDVTTHWIAGDEVRAPNYQHLKKQREATKKREAQERVVKRTTKVTEPEVTTPAKDTPWAKEWIAKRKARKSPPSLWSKSAQQSVKKKIKNVNFQ